MRNQSLLLGLLLFLLVSCSKESIDSNSEIKDQEKIKQEILNSVEYNGIKEKLDLQIEEEEAELRQIALDQSTSFIDNTDESFIFFVIGDSELNMRGNTLPQLENWINHINSVADYNLEFITGDFEEGESRMITKPELVFLAGDICKDRGLGFSLPGDTNFITKQQLNILFNELDDDILFFPGHGNHDWDPYQWGDGSWGNNLGGLLSNLGTVQFVRSRYQRAINSTNLDQLSSFNYDRSVAWWPAISSASFNYSLIYKGLRFTQLNNFLQNPVATVSLESLVNTGPATYYHNRSSAWFQSLCNQSLTDSVEHVVIQHYPVYTDDGWWTDYLGSTPNALRKEFLDMFSTSYKPTLFTGHNHFNRTTNVLPYNITDYTAGYFALGHVMVAKASASRGIYAVAYVDFNAMLVRDPAQFNATFTVPQ